MTEPKNRSEKRGRSPPSRAEDLEDEMALGLMERLEDENKKCKLPKLSNAERLIEEEQVARAMILAAHFPNDLIGVIMGYASSARIRVWKIEMLVVPAIRVWDMHLPKLHFHQIFFDGSSANVFSRWSIRSDPSESDCYIHNLSGLVSVFGFHTQHEEYQKALSYRTTAKQPLCATSYVPGLVVPTIQAVAIVDLDRKSLELGCRNVQGEMQWEQKKFQVPRFDYTIRDLEPTLHISMNSSAQRIRITELKRRIGSPEAEVLVIEIPFDFEERYPPLIQEGVSRIEDAYLM